MYNFKYATVSLVMLFIITSHVSAKSLEGRYSQNEVMPSSAIVDCVLRDPSQGKLLLQVDETTQLYTHRCTEGIYLIDKGSDPEAKLDNAVTVVQGWRLISLLGVHQPDGQSMIVDAHFITGVGPKGARPFFTRIRLNHVGRVWQVEEPVHLEAVAATVAGSREGKESVYKWGRWRVLDVYEVNSWRELEALSISPVDAFSSLDVNFSQQRLIIASMHLRSGVINVADLAVTKDDKSYQLHCATSTRGLPDKLPKTSLLWFTLPKDGLAVEDYDLAKHSQARSFYDFKSGVIKRGGIKNLVN